MLTARRSSFCPISETFGFAGVPADFLAARGDGQPNACPPQDFPAVTDTLKDP